MLKKRVVLMLSLFVALAMVPAVSAEILLGQPNNLYSAGDVLSMNITIVPSKTINDFVLINLHCGEDVREMYRNPLTLNAGERKTIPFSLRLDSSLLGRLEGDCFLHAQYDGEETDSVEFSITRKIDVGLNVNGISFDPGVVLKVGGTAKKRNGHSLEGFATLTISDLSLDLTQSVSRGEVSVNVTIPKNAAPGDYEGKIFAYDKDTNGEVMNQGVEGFSFSVKQKPERMVVGLQSVSATPGQPFSCTIMVYDQVSKEMRQQDVSMTVTDSNGTVFSRTTAKSGDSQSVSIPSNAIPGSWIIDAKSGALSARQQFNVGELMSASFEVLNGTLKVRNTGNVVYEKVVEVLINGTPVELTALNPLVIDIGGSKEFKLHARHDGMYPIAVNEGNSSINLGMSALTGSAISIRELKTLAGSKLAIVLWIVIILALLIWGWRYYRKRVEKRTFTGATPSSFRQMSHSAYAATKPRAEVSTIERKSFVPPLPQEENAKTVSVVLALNLKNRSVVENDSPAVAAIEHAKHTAKQARAYVYDEGNYIMAIFGGSSEKENAQQAIRIAKSIDIALRTYNKKHGVKIAYSIGINSGPMIIENLNGKRKYTSIGTTIVAAKMASERAEHAVILSTGVRRILAGLVKGEPMPGGQFWKVFNPHEMPAKDFLERFNKGHSHSHHH